jgi:Uncharacterized protein conserved in bacteria (DUF2059)
MRIRSLLLAACLAASGVTPAVLAQTTVEAPVGQAQVQELAETMMIGPLFALLREEGLAYGTSLETQMFPGGGGARWAATVGAIYDVPTLQAKFEGILATELADEPDAVAEMIGFFGSDRGQRILQLEIDARRALLDEAVEEAAQVTADKMTAARDPRMGLIRRLAEAGDLIEMNVAGALTGNLAFLQGMAQEGANGAKVDDEQLMSDVWGQEDQIRSDTETWLFPYLALAYQPLEDADLQAYIDFSESPAGKRLNAALFTAFDGVFKGVSYELGRAAGRAMLGNDI